MPKRPKTQVEAERAYRAKFVSVLVRFTTDEIETVDEARGDKSRAEWVKGKALPAKRKAKR